ncbi:uncharacterized protein VP01_3022g1, partial [Puccinia sorghi]
IMNNELHILGGIKYDQIHDYIINGSQPSEESPRKTEVTIHLKMMLLIKGSLKERGLPATCFGTGKAPAVGHPAKGTMNGFEMMAINLRNQSP